MTANEYQKLAMRTINVEQSEDRLLNAVFGLMGEVGEVTDMVKKIWWHGHDIEKPKLLDELGDVLWYVVLATDALGETLEEVMNRNIIKLKTRYPDGFDPQRSKSRDEA